ncbi:MAG: hypothetical protein AAB875_01920 [Patescibacteria group bacterium]
MKSELYQKELISATLVLSPELCGIKFARLGLATKLTPFKKIRGPKAQFRACLFLDIAFHTFILGT